MSHPTPSAAAPGAGPRRRQLLLLAAVLPLAAWRIGQNADAAPLRWHGTALGAPASLVLHHNGALPAAQAALAATLTELARLEAMFSLFHADSWLSRLNRAGHIDNAPSEFISLLRAALDMAQRSQGVFDPSVGPLWNLYFEHFVVAGQSAAPAPAALQRALALVDWRAVQISGSSVRLLRPGMALTLNGIAQGFVTDRCGELLGSYGFRHLLIDMGEPRAMAAKPDGSAWQIGLADPRAPSQALHTLSVRDAAVATSGGYGTLLDAAGRYTHLIDARNGRTAPAFESVTVVAPTAAQADALSTALALLPHTDVAARLALLRSHSGCRAICINNAGQLSELS